MATELPLSKQASQLTSLFHQGIAFYKAGSEKINMPHMSAVFNRMLEEKQLAVTMLAPFSDEGAVKGDAPREHELSLSQRYDDVLSALSLSSPTTDVSQLTAIEEKFLQWVDDALDGLSPGEFATELRCIRGRMQQCLDEMLALSR